MATDALKVELDQVARTLAADLLDSVLSLTDFRGSHASPEALGLIRSALSKTNGHGRKRAIVGFTGLRKKMLEGLAAFTGKAGLVPFDTLEAGPDCLVK